MITDHLLNVYFNKKGFDLYLNPGNTALWRGFFGSWEICSANKLYLNDLDGQTTAYNNNKYKEKRRELRALFRAKEITPDELQQKLKLVKQECFFEVVLTLNSVFNTDQPVFADWYTGPLILQSGELIQYVHLGYESVFENNTILEIENGILVGNL